MRFPPWGDLLTAYNGTAISYDEIGNPDGYSDRTFTWEHGRQLASQTKNGVEWTYTYDANGMRTKRSNGSTTYEYIYSGDLLVQMIITDHTAELDVSQIVEFSYDSSGMPLTMTYDGQTYYYVVNSQGDIMSFVDEAGNLKLNYTYEAFGTGYSNSSASTDAAELAAINPLTYRGYVQDVETGMYYLQTRYYDPSLGRFFNRDTTGVLELSAGAPNWDKNLYAYCDNNPVNREDIDGQGWHVLIAAAASGTIALITSLVSEICDAEQEGEEPSLKGYELLNVLVATTCASGDGALSALAPDWAPLISGGSALLESIVTDIIDDNLGSSPEKSSWPERIGKAVVAGGMSAATAALGGDEINRGGKMLEKVADYTGKASADGIRPLAKQQAEQAAQNIAKKVEPLFIKGSIRGQVLSFASELCGQFIVFYKQNIVNKLFCD